MQTIFGDRRLIPSLSSEFFMILSVLLLLLNTGSCWTQIEDCIDYQNNGGYIPISQNDKVTVVVGKSASDVTEQYNLTIQHGRDVVYSVDNLTVLFIEDLYYRTYSLTFTPAQFGLIAGNEYFFLFTDSNGLARYTYRVRVISPFTTRLVAQHVDEGGIKYSRMYFFNDGPLDNVFLISTGIDAENSPGTGYAEYYYRMMDLLQGLGEGIDLVIYDCYDGSIDLNENAQIFETAIEECYSLVYPQRVTVAGISMGGLISRLALQSMYYSNNHPAVKVKQYYSFDSPHKGAIIDQSLQAYLFNHDATSPLLESIAAKQMLAHHGRSGSSAIRQAFVSNLDRTFPNSENFSITNYPFQSIGVAFGADEMANPYSYGNNCYLTVEIGWFNSHDFRTGPLSQHVNNSDYCNGLCSHSLSGSYMPSSWLSSSKGIYPSWLSFNLPLYALFHNLQARAITHYRDSKPTFIPTRSALAIPYDDLIPDTPANTGLSWLSQHSPFDIVILPTESEFHTVIPIDIVDDIMASTTPLEVAISSIEVDNDASNIYININGQMFNNIVLNNSHIDVKINDVQQSFQINRVNSSLMTCAIPLQASQYNSFVYKLDIMLDCNEREIRLRKDGIVIGDTQNICIRIGSQEEIEVASNAIDLFDRIGVDRTIVFANGIYTCNIKSADHHLELYSENDKQAYIYGQISVIGDGTVKIEGLNVCNPVGRGINVSYNAQTNEYPNVEINDCKIFGCNYEGNGGAIYVVEGVVSVNDSEISFNSAYGYDNQQCGYNGGAIYNDGGTINLTRTVLRENFSSGKGGAIYNDWILNVSESTIDGNHSHGPGGGIYNRRWMNVRENSIMMDNDNQIDWNNPIPDELYVDHGYGQNTPVNISDCLIGDGKVVLNGSGGTFITNCLLKSRKIDITSLNNNTHFNRCTFTSNVDPFEGTTSSVVFIANSILLSSYFNSNVINVNNTASIVQINGFGNCVYSENEMKLVSCNVRGFVAREPGWNSPLLDRVEQNAYNPIEFDNTICDLGWKPMLRQLELTPSIDLDNLQRAKYLISGDQCFSSGELRIPAGSMIKVESGKTLQMKSTVGPITIGDINGPRTSIVAGSPFTPQTPRAHSIVIGDLNHPKAASINGVLFNCSPVVGYNFSGLMGAQVIASGYGKNVEFRAPESRPLTFAGCESVLVKGIEFGYGNAGRHGRLNCVLSKLTVENCQFTSTLEGDQSAPLFLMSPAGTTVKNCSFSETNELQGSYPSCYQIQGYSLYRWNQFNSNHIPLLLDYATAIMTNNAANQFTRGGGTELGFDNPLIRTNYGSLDLHCGYNTFVNPRAIIGNGGVGVKYVSPINNPANQAVWDKNFWGTSSSSPIACENVYRYVPSWADASNCLGEFAPPYYFCPQTDNEALELWTGGQSAELCMQYAMAIWYYSEIIRLYPTSKQAPLAADRLKALGKLMAELQMDAKAALLEASGVSASLGDAWLSMTQFTAAQCLEARHGDQGQALVTLDSLVQTGEPLAMDLATLALLEINTYPLEGGLSALTAEGGLAAMRAQEDALQALLSFQSGQHVTKPGKVMPASFQISKIYPNPFNPTTHILIEVSEVSEVLVQVFDLLGRQVKVLADREMLPGQYVVMLDGTDMASGMYLVRAQAGSISSSQKVMLLK